MKFQVNDKGITIVENERLVQNNVKQYICEYEFSEEWDGYTAMAVFQNKKQTTPPKKFMIIDGKAEIPADVLKDNGSMRFGIYGLKDDIAIIATMWTSWQPVYEGTDTHPEDATIQQRTEWQQAIEQVGELAEIASEAKNDTVAARDEAIEAKDEAVESANAAEVYAIRAQEDSEDAESAKQLAVQKANEARTSANEAASSATSASTSASNAASYEYNAEQAEAATIQARNDAVTAKNVAEQARDTAGSYLNQTISKASSADASARASQQYSNESASYKNEALAAALLAENHRIAAGQAKDAAQTSATNASTSATNAATSASNASTSASQASASADDASDSASAASSSASEALASAVAAEEAKEAAEELIPSTGGEIGDVLTKTETGVEWETPAPSGVSSVNGKTGAVTIYANDVGALPDTTVVPTKTSQLQNDSGFLTSHQDISGKVDKFQGTSYSGKVLGINAQGYVTPVTGGSGGGAVDSVNGKTGNVILDAEDVGALPNTTVIPNVPNWALQPSKPTYTASEVGALPDTTTIPSSLSELAADSTHRVVTDTEKSTWNSKASEDDIQDLQEQIDAIVSASDVKDVVGTYAELQSYDTSTLGNNDIVKVLNDSTHSNGRSYYRWIITGSSGSWSYIGTEGIGYTKAEADELLENKQDIINDLDAIRSGALEITNVKTRLTAIENKESDWDAKYTKPSEGIPKNDLASSVQSSLTNADNALKYTEQTLTEAQYMQARKNLGLYYKEGSAEYILPERTIAYPDDPWSSDDLDLNLGVELVVGNTYTVTFNGTKYNVTAKVEESSTEKYLGNLLWWELEEDTGEPFLFAPSFVSDTHKKLFLSPDYYNTTVTISVAIDNVTYHKIPEEYLPDESATKEYVDSAIEEAIGNAIGGEY